jgi:hypothetical protein
MHMRLTLSALLCAALISGPALAHDHHGEQMMPPPPGVDMPPPPGFDRPDNGDGYGAPMDPRWAQDQDRMRGEWMERCGRHHGHDDRDRSDNDRPNRGGPGRDGCSYGGPQGAYGYGYPGAYMGYAVPMIMVPVLRSKPCPQVVEEWVDEVVPVRHRLIRPRAHVVHDKRVRVIDKRVRMTPSKRIAY